MLTPGTYVIAFDPGGTSGVAVAEYIGGRNFKVLLVEEIKWTERRPRIKQLLIEYSILAEERGVELVIVCEIFLIYPNMVQALAYSKCESAIVEGVIETYCHELGLMEPVYQKPKDRLAVDVLNEDFHWVRGSDHKMDAYQHLRLYILRNRPKGS